MPVVWGMLMMGPDLFSFALPTNPLFVFNRFFQRTWSKSSSFKPTSFRVFRPVLKEQQLWDRGYQSDQRFNVKKKRENFARLLCHWVAKEQHLCLWKKTIRKETATHFLIPPLSGLQRSKGGTPKCVLAFLYPAAMKIYQRLRPQARMNSFSSYVPNKKMDVHLAQSTPELGKTQPATPWMMAGRLLTPS